MSPRRGSPIPAQRNALGSVHKYGVMVYRRHRDSRGGYSTKLHLLCDSEGHPLSYHLTPGQAHESTLFDIVLEKADKNLLDGSGRKEPWPVRLAGDKGYRADWIDTCLKDLKILPVIPSKSNEDRDSRPVPFDGEAYRKRNIVERIIGWIKENRRVFSRF